MVFGQQLRKNNHKILDKVLKKFFDKEKYYDVLPPQKLQKIIDTTAKIGDFFLSIAFFLALSGVFIKILLPKLGFETTIVLMLTIIIFVLRSFIETISAKN